jgi:hypothetical protein
MPFTLLKPDGIDLSQTFAFTGSVTGAGGGKVLNYKYVSNTQTPVTIDSTTWTDSNITLTYTPSSTDSRLIININAYANLMSTTGTGVGLKRAISGGATTTQLGDATVGFVYHYNQNVEKNISFEHIDHPNTTSAVTYTLNARREGGSGNAIGLGQTNKRTNFHIYEISGAPL